MGEHAMQISTSVDNHSLKLKRRSSSSSSHYQTPLSNETLLSIPLATTLPAYPEPLITAAEASTLASPSTALPTFPPDSHEDTSQSHTPSKLTPDASRLRPSSTLKRLPSYTDPRTVPPPEISLTLAVPYFSTNSTSPTCSSSSSSSILVRANTSASTRTSRSASLSTHDGQDGLVRSASSAGPLSRSQSQIKSRIRVTEPVGEAPLSFRLSRSPSQSLRAPSPSGRSMSSDYVSASEHGHEDDAKTFRANGSAETVSAQNSRRWHVLMEIVDSEKAYINDLRILVKIYLEALGANTSLHLTPAELDLVSLNARNIYQLHEPLAQKFEDAVADLRLLAPGKGKEPFSILEDEVSAVTELAKCLIDAAPGFDIYQEFCSDHSEAVDILRRIQFKPEWEAFEKQCAADVEGGRSHFTASAPTTAPPSPKVLHKARNPSRASVFSTSITLTPSSPPKSFSSTRRGSIPDVTYSAENSPPGLPDIFEHIALPETGGRHPPILRHKSSRPTSLQHGRRHSTEDTTIAEESKVPDSDPIIPPVPQLPPSLINPSSHPSVTTSSLTKSLRFRDFFIKPIQRVCRYPLLLDQLRMPQAVPGKNLDVLEQALSTMRKVAQDVDHARERKEASMKSRLIVERFEAHPVILPSFLLNLGDCRFAGALDVVYHHPIFSPLAAPIKVKYYGSFAYDGYMVLVRVRKNKVYQPRHWFPLRSVRLIGVEDDDALLSNSFRVVSSDHVFELGAACAQEKVLWMQAISKARDGSSPTAEYPDSSLQAFEGQSPAGQIQSAPTPTSKETVLPSSSPLRPRKRQQSLPPSPSAMTAPTPFANILENGECESPIADSPDGTVPDGDRFNSLSLLQRPGGVKRSSTVHIPSMFATAGPVTVATRRASTQNRAIVDRNLADVFTNACTTARGQAHVRGELFKPLKLSIPSASQPPDDAGKEKEKRQSISNAVPRPRRRSIIGGVEVPRMFTNSDSTATPGMTSSSPTRHRKTRSMPKPSSALPPLVIEHPSRITPRTDNPSRVRRSILQVDKTEPSSPTSILDDRSEEDSPLWDEALSSSHTDPTTEEGGQSRNPARSQSFAGSFAGSVRSMLSRRQTTGHVVTTSHSSPPKRSRSHTDHERRDSSCALPPAPPMSYHGHGITNHPPPSAAHRSLLQRSLSAITRRRTRSTPAPITTTVSEDDECTLSPINRALSEGGRPGSPTYSRVSSTTLRSKDPLLLSPYWSQGPPSARSSSSAILEHDELAEAPVARGGLDLYRVHPVENDFLLPEPVHQMPPSHSLSPKKSRRSLFQHFNGLTPLASS